jgi:hypothetical protein
MIEGESLEDRESIVQYIKITTDALILNHQGIVMDGGSKFTAQLLTPITVYNEMIVHGKLNNWLNFLRQKQLPKELEIYRRSVQDVLSAEWRNLDSLVRSM